MTKTALVTGASSGIGRATCFALSNLGYQLILLARRADKMLELQQQLRTPSQIIECDVNNHQQIATELDNLAVEFSEIDVLVNNAGLALGLGKADKADWKDWQTMIDTNCSSLAFLTLQVLPGMRVRNKGHIINIGSVAGTYAYQGGNVYGATKAFVEQFSQNLRTDLLGSALRVTNIEPGLLGETEFSLTRFHGDEKAAKSVYEGCRPLGPEDVAESVRWVVDQPAHVNINRIEIMPTCQASGGLAVHKQP